MSGAVSYDPQETSVAVTRLREFVDKYEGRRKVFLLVGPFGSGKSWCLRQVAGHDSVNVGACLSRACRTHYGDKFDDIARQSPEHVVSTVGEVMREEFLALLSNQELVFLDNIELLYTYPYFDFVREAETVSEGGTRIVIAVPGYTSQSKVYFIDKNLFNLQIGPTRVNRYFELKGVTE